MQILVAERAKWEKIEDRYQYLSDTKEREVHVGIKDMTETATARLSTKNIDNSSTAKSDMPSSIGKKGLTSLIGQDSSSTLLKK